MFYKLFIYIAYPKLIFRIYRIIFSTDRWLEIRQLRIRVINPRGAEQLAWRIRFAPFFPLTVSGLPAFSMAGVNHRGSFHRGQHRCERGLEITCRDPDMLGSRPDFPSDISSLENHPWKPPRALFFSSPTLLLFRIIRGSRLFRRTSLLNGLPCPNCKFSNFRKK